MLQAETLVQRVYSLIFVDLKKMPKAVLFGN